MEDIISRTSIGKTWNRFPMDSKMVSKTSGEDKRPKRPVVKCNKCGHTSHLANTCTKKTKINEVQVIEEIQYTEEKKESDLDSAVSEDTPVEDYPIENIADFFEGTEVHTHLPQYSKDFHTLINNQNARICKSKSTRGKDYLQAILPEWKNYLLPIEGVQFSSTSNNMYPLGILDTSLLFPHPAGSNTFVSDNEPLGAIKGNEVDITLNIDRPYPPVLRRPAYLASPIAREALEKHIEELIQLAVLRKVGHNKEVEVTKPVIIA
ncbi:hypothetical protein O181_025963 [Austropuccinia psidii MF-1]|uniref:Uncharacterized protein n=1 Tax=Austropuccinia psidii MF-1 TaxID=1389203 RepID=A0A9Q3GZL1_9BASI|nr:hypothetical protein [Austropuccinia psidii MF-1]